MDHHVVCVRASAPSLTHRHSESALRHGVRPGRADGLGPGTKEIAGEFGGAGIHVPRAESPSLPTRGGFVRSGGAAAHARTSLYAFAPRGVAILHRFRVLVPRAACAPTLLLCSGSQWCRTHKLVLSTTSPCVSDFGLFVQIEHGCVYS